MGGRKGGREGGRREGWARTRVGGLSWLRLGQGGNVGNARARGRVTLMSSCVRCSNPKSNSWLPKHAASIVKLFSAGTICKGRGKGQAQAGGRGKVERHAGIEAGAVVGAEGWRRARGGLTRRRICQDMPSC